MSEANANPKIVPVKYGGLRQFKLSYEIEDEIIHEIRHTGAYDRYVFSVIIGPKFKQRFGPLATVLDIGANIGTYAIPLALNAGDKGKVIAVEGSAETSRVLRENVRLNGLNSIDVITAVVMRDEQAVVETVRDAQSSQSTFGPSEQQDETPAGAKQEVISTTVDALCRDLTELDFIKVDVNGYDFDILLGGRETIQRFRPVIMVEFTPKEISKDVFTETMKMFGDNGYAVGFFRGHWGGALEPMDGRMLMATYDCWHGNGGSSWLNLVLMPTGKPKSP